MDKTYVQKIMSIENEIEFEIKGVICGLLNGKIALHHKGNFIKTCNIDSNKQDENYPISINIANSQTNEIMAKYSVGFDN